MFVFETNETVVINFLLELPQSSTLLSQHSIGEREFGGCQLRSLQFVEWKDLDGYAL